MKKRREEKKEGVAWGLALISRFSWVLHCDRCMMSRQQKVCSITENQLRGGFLDQDLGAMACRGEHSDEYVR